MGDVDETCLIENDDNGIMPSIPGLTRLRWNSDAEQVDVQYKQMDKPAEKPAILRGMKGWIIFLLTFLVVFVVGFVLGYVIRRSIQASCDTINTVPDDASHVKSYHDYSKTVGDSINKFINSDSIRNSLRSYSRFVHVAGRKNNDILADEIKRSWINSGLDTTRIKTYKVLMSYPDPLKKRRNFVGILDDNNTVLLQCTSMNVDDPASIPYSAWSANGTAEGDLVYANYGRLRDFEALAASGVNVTGKIVIMRYGWGFRGDKIEHAQERGAIGAILYPDPADYSKNPNEIWPKGWWIDGNTVQVGTVRYDGGGDPLTPDGPSVDGAYRIPMDETRLPKIPVQPITFNEAQLIMANLDGEVISDDFKGTLNIPYKSGPGFFNQSDWKLKLTSYNQRYQVPIKNIIGYIRGHEEPDRYVMLCNHRDAWSGGANDPSGGTAILTEVARAFGQYHETTGWQPRRTIIFANWDAEEFGLIGSFEWAEEHAQEIRDRLVAVINIDSPMKGNYSMSARSSPSLNDVIINAAKSTPDVTSSDNVTVFDTWSERSKAKIGYLGGGSDQTSFLHMFGIPAAYPAYTYNRKKYDYLPSPPFYHTPLDTFEMVEKYIDPGFKAHESLAHVLSDILLRLSESAKLPLAVKYYIVSLQEASRTCKQKYTIQLKPHGISLDLLDSAVDNFTRAADDFMVHMEKLDPKKAIVLREANDRIMQMSRSFIYNAGLPNRPQIRNVLLAPSSLDWYSGAVFPGVTDAIAVARNDSDWLIVKQQLSILIVAIQSAARILAGGVVGVNIL